MFKLICDLTKKYYEPAIETNSTILAYNNCKPCGAVSYKLTSSSNDNSLSVAQQAAAIWSTNALNPANPAYRDTYAKLLPEKDLSSHKYIGLFEDNNQLDIVARLGNTSNVVPIYESIYNGDEKIWVKANYLKFPASVTLRPGIFEQKETQFGPSHIIDLYFLNYIRANGWSECSPVESHEYRDTDDYNHYVNSVRTQVKESIVKAYASIRICKVNDDNIAIIDASEDLEQQLSICNGVGGTLSSDYEMIKDSCKKSEGLTLGNDAFNVNCENYQDVLPELLTGDSSYYPDEL